MEIFQVRDLESYLLGLRRIFDNVRLINPPFKKVVYTEDSKVTVQGSSCYEFWDRKSPCENCLYKDLSKNKSSSSKIRCIENETFLVMTTIIIFKDTEYMVEMIKNLSHIDEIYGQDIRGMSEAVETISRLNEKLLKDELTGVYNKRYINKKLPEDIKYALKNKEELSIIMLDIDDFKEINDIFGHLAGDVVLKKIAETIRSNIRNNYDLVARFGGDEFVVMIKDAGYNVCKKVVDNIRFALKEKAIVYNEHKINVTISVGGCAVRDGKKGIDEIIYITDKNLNLAKRNGKDTAVLSQ